jgi:hypothetical protein
LMQKAATTIPLRDAPLLFCAVAKLPAKRGSTGSPGRS